MLMSPALANSLLHRLLKSGNVPVVNLAKKIRVVMTRIGDLFGSLCHCACCFPRKLGYMK